MMHIKLTRTIDLPDLVKLERYRFSPDLGPKLLFFSGGSALRDTSIELIKYTHFSSLIANLLPSGVGKAISLNPCPKIFVPNTGSLDPETYGIDLNEQIEMLLFYLTKDDTENISVDKVINFILIDKENGRYPGNPDTDWLRHKGIRVINTRLVSPETAPYVDERLLAPVLLSLV